MKTAVAIFALGGALVLQATLAGLSVGGVLVVNLVLVAVVCLGLLFGPVAGLLSGCAGGLVQDAVGGGIIGTGGLSKTIVGFFVGVLGAQFIVSQSLPRLVMFFGATILHEFCFQGLNALVEMRGMSMDYSSMFTQAGVNAVVGVAAFIVMERGPELLQGRHSRRASLSRRRY
jgi:rod shape-determining protein MreD